MNSQQKKIIDIYIHVSIHSFGDGIMEQLALNDDEFKNSLLFTVFKLIRMLTI